MYCKNCGIELNSDGTCPNCILGKTENDMLLDRWHGLKKYKIGLILLLVIIVVSSLFMIFMNNKDFGDASWGMSQKEVMDMEKKRGNLQYETNTFGTQDRLTYANVNIEGWSEGKVEYGFKNDKLVTGIYRLDFSTLEVYTRAKDELVGVLDQKYGISTEHKGVSADDKALYRNWENNRTQIIMQYGEHNPTDFYINIYYDPSWVLIERMEVKINL